MNGDIDFLDDAYIDAANEYFRLSEPIVEAFRKETERINGDPELQRKARIYHRILVHSGDQVQKLNAELLAMGPEAGMFAAVIYASALPSAIGLYREKGIPLSILRDTLEDFDIWIRHHREKYGVWGLSELGWFTRHFRCGIFRLGRLQFMPRTCYLKIKVFRNRDSGALVALSDTGVAFRADGQIDGTNGVTDPDGRWEAVYTNDGRTASGNQIWPQGYADRRRVELDLLQWELVLEEGDWVLDVHIPAGGPMTHGLCRDSYRQAAAFVREYMSGRDIKAFVCHSWLLSPQLGRILPETSNIVKFQRDYRLVPVLSDDHQLFERVFGLKTTDLSGLPRDTTLRRRVLEYLSAGNVIHGAAGFMTWNELEYNENQ